jgi:hypothetical protein
MTAENNGERRTFMVKAFCNHGLKCSQSQRERVENTFLSTV